MKKMSLILVIVLVSLLIVGCGKKEETEINNSSNNESNNTVSNNESENNSSIFEGNSEDVQENWEKLQDNNPDVANDIKENVSDISMTSSNNQYVIKQGEITSIYYHNGTEITGLEGRVTCDSYEDAVLAKDSYVSEEDDDVDSIKIEGNEIVVTYKPSAYADMTLDDVKQTYELLNMIQGN